MTSSARERIAPLPVPGFEHVRRIWQPQLDAFVAKVLPGEYYVTRGGEWVGTVLGSCVSACIRDPQAALGGLNHFMLPDAAERGRWGNSGVDLAHRYGSYAMEHMINDLLKLGASRTRLEVKLVGGGRMLEHMSDVGARNIEFVRGYLRKEGLQVAGEDLGGSQPRRVVYDVLSGRVRVRKLPVQIGRSIAREELDYHQVIRERQITGDVELF